MVTIRTVDALNQAADEWRVEFEDALTENAADAYTSGAATAYRTLRRPEDWMVISSAAREYAKEYSAELEEKGGTTINGEFKPWLSERDAKTRESVTEIIRRGIEQGKPTGRIESLTGNYPKGTIAYELKEYFDERKSHATMVARTEVARIQNEAKMGTWRDELEVRYVQVTDGGLGDTDEPCMVANGQIWGIEYARAHPIEHPNCTRFFDPIDPLENVTPDRE